MRYHKVIVFDKKCFVQEMFCAGNDDTLADSLAVMIYEYSLSGIE